MSDCALRISLPSVFDWVQDPRTQVALRARQLFLQLRKLMLQSLGVVPALARQVLQSIRPLGLLRLQPVTKRFHLLLYERFQRIEALFQIIAQGIGSFGKPFFQTREPLFVVPHL